MTVVTRFAPSPTGFLHIGGARTALFNWLYAKHEGGLFRLRIEDTDAKRSTEAAVAAIFEGLEWLGLTWEGEALFQSQAQDRHREVAEALLAAGQAYRCYASKEELAEMREKARAEGRPMRYDRRWRDRDPAEAPPGVPPVIRFKAPQGGETVVQDRVMGEVRVAHDQLDDMVLLRADGTPTYMLAVVVDDHDMGVTHVIRGADHLNNALRQANLIAALGWELPVYAHVPLIHGPDGAKLSKRHGALGVEEYREMGYLAEAMRNYLERLGWSHGDDEIFSTDQAVEWFGLDGLGKSAARFDFAKLENLNGHYLRDKTVAALEGLVIPRLAQSLGRGLSEAEVARLEQALPDLKDRAKTLSELTENALFYFTDGAPEPDPKAAKILDPAARALLGRLAPVFEHADEWQSPVLEARGRAFAEVEEVKFVKIAQPLRAAITGRTVSPGIFQVCQILGREETLRRLRDAVPAP